VQYWLDSGVCDESAKNIRNTRIFTNMLLAPAAAPNVNSQASVDGDATLIVSASYLSKL